MGVRGFGREASTSSSLSVVSRAVTPWCFEGLCSFLFQQSCRNSNVDDEEAPHRFNIDGPISRLHYCVQVSSTVSLPDGVRRISELATRPQNPRRGIRLSRDQMTRAAFPRLRSLTTSCYAFVLLSRQVPVGFHPRTENPWPYRERRNRMLSTIRPWTLRSWFAVCVTKKGLGSMERRSGWPRATASTPVRICQKIPTSTYLGIWEP